MAKQHGPIKLQGTIGDITFFKGDDGTYGAKAKSEVSKERIATDPAFIRTRENGQEFGRAGKNGKVLRLAFQSMIKGADKRMVGRLQRSLMKCLKADTTNDRGQRSITDGDPTLVQGFDFNVSGKLSTTLLIPFTTNVTRTTGILDVAIPSFVPYVSLSAPLGATHYKLQLASAEVDFTTNTFKNDIAASTELPINNVANAALTLSTTLTPNTAQPLFMVLSVQFYQLVNGSYYGLNNGGFDAVSIIKVDA